MAVSKRASKTTNKGRMQEANSIRCKYVLFLRMLDQEFLSKLPAALIFVREPPVCCVIAQLCSCEQNSSFAVAPFAQRQTAVSSPYQFSIPLSPSNLCKAYLEKNKKKKPTKKTPHQKHSPTGHVTVTMASFKLLIASHLQ